MADGYCFLNGAGMAVETARSNGHARIAVVDWDVHHGNGAQTGFYQRDHILFISIQMNHGEWGDARPETGDVNETGEGEGTGFNLNLPLPFGVRDSVYGEIITTIVIPALETFGPDLIVVSNRNIA